MMDNSSSNPFFSRSVANSSRSNQLMGQNYKLTESIMEQKTASPVDLVVGEFRAHGLLVNDQVGFCPESLVFVRPTDDMIDAYKMEVVSALRSEKVDALRALHEAGHQLQCCNKFGESLIHMACRRGLTEIVRFLVRDANVSLLVKDDYGRTPLHDAFWTPTPRFELVQFIIEEVPELLCVRDSRGHLPLNYVRKEDWQRWCEFFLERRELLRPKQQ